MCDVSTASKTSNEATATVNDLNVVKCVCFIVNSSRCDCENQSESLEPTTQQSAWMELVAVNQFGLMDGSWTVVDLEEGNVSGASKKKLVFSSSNRQRH